MSVPGGVGGMNSVGAIYVSVLTDTSGMKGEIEDAAGKAGAAGNRQFNKSWQEEQNKHADDLLFSKAVEARMKKSAKRFGKEFSNSLVTGIGDPKLNIDRMVSDDLTKIADKFGKLPKDVKEAWEGQFKGILSRQMDQEIAKVERNMGGLGRNIGDVIGDGLDKSDLDKKLRKLLGRVAYDVKAGVVGNSQEIFAKYGDEFEKLSKRFNVPIVDISGQIQKQLPAAMKDLERLAEKQRAEQLKAHKAQVALNEKLEKARIATEEKVFAEATRLNQKFNEDSERFAAKAQRDEIRFLTQRVAAENRLQEERVRNTLAIGDRILAEEEKINKAIIREAERAGGRDEGIFSKLFSVDRATLALFRAGTPNSPFGAMTGGFALVTGAANLAFKAINLIPKAIEAAGDAFIKFGGLVARVAPRIGAVIGRAGAVIGGLGAALAPVAVIVGLFGGVSILIKGLGIVVAAFKAVIGIMTLFAGAAFHTAASMVIVASAAASLAIGVQVAKFGMKDTLSAVQALNEGLTTGDWEAYNEAMKKLGPNAQAAVKSLRPFLQALENIRKPLGEKIFANVGTVVSAAGKQFGFLEEMILGIGTAINDVIIRFAALGGNRFFVESIRTLMGAAIPIIVNFGKAASDAFAGIVNVLGIVAPLAVQFSEKVSGIAERFRLFTESAAGHTAVEGFFERAWNIANIVWDIFKKVGIAIASVLDKTYETNSGPNGFLMKIEGTLDRLLNWINANPDSIGQWFGDSKAVAEGIWHAIESIGSMIDSLDTEENMKSLESIIGLIGSVASALNTVIEHFETVYNWLNKNPNETTWAKFPKSQFAFGPGIQNPQPYGPGLPTLPARPGQPVPTDAIVPFLSNDAKALRRAAGGLVRQKELTWLGESGPELVIPLRRPLGLIDPEARPAAKMLQDMKRAPQSTGPTKVVNLTQNITPIQSDPKAVAASVINRAVALARV